MWLEDQWGGGGGPEPLPPRRRPVERSAKVNNSVLAAAMLAVGEIIEPSNTHVEIVAEAPALNLPLDIDFGDLPPLDR
jgi:hypothetical protein